MGDTVIQKAVTTITNVKTKIVEVVSVLSKIGAFVGKHWKLVLVIIIILGVGYGINQIINHFVISNLHNDIQHLQSTVTSLTKSNTELGAEVKSGNDIASQFKLELSRLQSSFDAIQSDYSKLEKSNSDRQSNLSGLEEAGKRIQSDNNGIASNNSEIERLIGEVSKDLSGLIKNNSGSK